jgi:small subunit ribosomal protein S21
MIRIEARSGEPLEKTLKRFKKACEKEGLAKDIKKNAYYEKPSDKMRRRQRNSLKRISRESRERRER